ncbi:hypothetical protein Trydic_g20179 [Trypoxylus dichotomus]
MNDTKQNQNLSFQQLNDLIDNWITDTLDTKLVFQNQADFIKQHFFEVGAHHEQLQQINGWINVLRYYNRQMENDIETVSQNLTRLEASVEKLERKLPEIDDLRVVAPCRTRLYDVFNNVFASLQQWREFNDITSKAMCTIDEERSKSPAEQLAKIMVKQMETLEEMEVKLYRMMTNIANIETERNMIMYHTRNKLRNPC